LTLSGEGEGDRESHSWEQRPKEKDSSQTVLPSYSNQNKKEETAESHSSCSLGFKASSSGKRGKREKEGHRVQFRCQAAEERRKGKRGKEYYHLPSSIKKGCDARKGKEKKKKRNRRARAYSFAARRVEKEGGRSTSFSPNTKKGEALQGEKKRNTLDYAHLLIISNYPSECGEKGNGSSNILLSRSEKSWGNRKEKKKRKNTGGTALY